ncbi:GDSL-type esterase/lipase family protein [Corynebacterium sp. TAE3-ERU30]|uniref:GDSL-type esterase/lipase family protein n=1 Tax=Corynebacterium sp. TAE3-ERU30 TaxID=2849496 RepID=UPI001C462052|nr:GDSL-type esterase/lipase family protein [Corynebacterium sp. TAE3-ERU30]MBV7282204.1 esterase [Corynebacterium sp. TAE3-ERU30]
MGFTTGLKKVTAAMLGVATAAVVGVSAAPVAAAAPQGNIAYFGDSYSANPDQILNAMRGMNPQVYNGYPNREGCLQAPNNAPRLLGQIAKAPISDWSCVAETSRVATQRVTRAIQAGDIHPGTRAVVLAAGMNNYGGFGVRDGVNILDNQAVHNAYLKDIHDAVNQIRRVSPRIQIIIPGMLQVTEPTSGMLCALNVVPNAPMGVPVPLLRDVENWNRDNQKVAARQTGATFVDIKAGSAAHHTCVPDMQRWVSGSIDTTTPNYNMGLHPSEAGSRYVAQRIAAALR